MVHGHTASFRARSDPGSVRSCCLAARSPSSCICAVASVISSGTPSTASVDLHFGMDGRRVERGAHCGGMGDQPVRREVAPMNRRSFRSPLARALGLGSAKSGVRHWGAERVTAVALVPLCLWLIASIIAHSGSDYPVLIAWIRTPLATGCMVLLLIALFHHSSLGLQIVIEDYVHSGVRFAAIVPARLLRTRRDRHHRHSAHFLRRLNEGSPCLISVTDLGRDRSLFRRYGRRRRVSGSPNRHEIFRECASLARLRPEGSRR